MVTESTLRFSAQTDEVTSLLRIVNLVRTGEAVTRPEIGTASGLGRGVVTQRIERAAALGYLGDSDLAPSSGGRAPRTLRFLSERGRILVCAFGAFHINVGLTALEGDVLAQDRREWDIAQGPDASLDVAFEMIDALLRAHPGAPLWGIGVGVPGPVDFSVGIPIAPPIMPGWNNADVRGRFHERYGAPAWVDNDVNLLVCGERARRGAEDGDLIYCKVGTGIGAGFLSSGRLHRGSNGAAGDIGHIPVTDGDVRCRCGKIGCLEALASGWALVRDARTAIDAGEETSIPRDAVTPEAISLAAEGGDTLARTLTRESAKIVGDAIGMLVNVFNPAVIVIGGSVAGVAGQTYLAGIRQRIYDRSLPLATRDLKVEQSRNDIREPIRGGAELVREQLFEATFARWFADGKPSIEAIFADA